MAEVGGSGLVCEVGEYRIRSNGKERFAVGDRVDLGEVLFVRKGSTLKVGQPTVPGAKVEAVVVEHGLGDKVIVFKKKRRKQYRRTRGHRQMYTALRIDEITMAAASKPTEASAKKPESA